MNGMRSLSKLEEDSKYLRFFPALGIPLALASEEFLPLQLPIPQFALDSLIASFNIDYTSTPFLLICISCCTGAHAVGPNTLLYEHRVQRRSTNLC